jgi:anti-sigma factor RsiW
VSFRARHLQEDRLFECYLAEQAGEPVEPPAAEHLTDCTDCGARYADLRRFMDGLRTHADSEVDEIYPPERMRAQQQHIARKIEHFGHHARVISFPGHPASQPARSAGSHAMPRWIGAAAAGLVIGIGVSSHYYSQVPAGQPRTVASSNIAAPVDLTASPSAIQLASDANEEFFSELELALERPHTRELVALDDLTPHVREVRVQLR